MRKATTTLHYSAAFRMSADLRLLRFCDDIQSLVVEHEIDWVNLIDFMDKAREQLATKGSASDEGQTSTDE